MSPHLIVCLLLCPLQVLPKALQGYYVKYIKARSGTGEATGTSLASETVAGSDNSGLSSSTSASTSIQGNGSHTSGHKHKATGNGHCQSGASDAHGSAFKGSTGDGSPIKASGINHGGSNGSHGHGGHKKGHGSNKIQSSGPRSGNGHTVPEAVAAANGVSSSGGGGSSSVAGGSSAGHGVTGNGARKGYWKSRLHDYWEDGAMPRALREYWSNRSRYGGREGWGNSVACADSGGPKKTWTDRHRGLQGATRETRGGAAEEESIGR